MKNAKCPYCGREMLDMHYKQAYWYDCLYCNFSSPAADSAEKAYAALYVSSYSSHVERDKCERS